MFTTPFDSYVTDGDTIECEVDGFTAVATLHVDDDTTPPWEREDGHGPVSDWTSREPRKGERVLKQDGGFYRYYDFDAAVKIAKKDGWDAEPYGVGTPDERAKRAAERDFKVLKAWCDDEWHYFGVAVTVSKADVELVGKYEHAMWRIDGNYPDSDNSYFLQVANELLPVALEAARKKVAALTGATLAETDEDEVKPPTPGFG